MTSRRNQLLAPWITLLLLGGLGAFTYTRETPADAEPYHRRVQLAVERLPLLIGPWMGKKESVPDGAAALLHPNAITSRRYQNMETGQTLTYLLVHCRDARDMEGHFPPVCYAGQGWIQGETTPVDLPMGDTMIPAMEYHFSRIEGAYHNEQIIDNFMVLPDGKIARDMDGVYQTARAYKKRFYGAGQIQLIFPVGTSDAQRHEAIKLFLAASEPIIQTILAGVQR